MSKIFAVTGNPVLHSKSPVLFNTVFQHIGEDARYVRFAADNAEEIIHFINEAGIAGMNVTAPFKQDVMPFLDITDIAAKEIQSVNTVVNKNGQLTGYNTDYLGVIDSLMDAKVNPAGKKALVIGAGGAARAAIYGLKIANAHVFIANRTFKKAIILASEFDCKAVNFDYLGDAVSDSEIIISTLSSDIQVIKKEWLRKEQVVFDANYKNSPLIGIAQEIGCKTITGEKWLINQALPAYKYFLDAKPESEVMKKALISIIEPTKLLSIIVFTKDKNFIGKQTSGKEFTINFTGSLTDLKSIPDLVISMNNKSIDQINEKIYAEINKTIGNKR